LEHIMTNDADDTLRDTIALIRAGGLALTDEEARQVAVLRARYARDRAALAGADLGQAEPAVIFRAADEAGGDA
jgi:hypothetical protein